MMGSQGTGLRLTFCNTWDLLSIPLRLVHSLVFIAFAIVIVRFWLYLYNLMKVICYKFHGEKFGQKIEYLIKNTIEWISKIGCLLSNILPLHTFFFLKLLCSCIISCNKMPVFEYRLRCFDNAEVCLCTTTIQIKAFSSPLSVLVFPSAVNLPYFRSHTP